MRHPLLERGCRLISPHWIAWGRVGSNTSIAIGQDGRPVISYYDETNTALKVARCNDPPCTSATFTKVASTAQVSLQIS